MKTKKISLQTANGKKLAEVNIVINVCVNVGKEKINQSFIVMPGMRLDMILGSDFLSMNKAVVDLEKREMKVGNCRVEFVEENECEVAQNDNLINYLWNKKICSHPSEMKENYESPITSSMNEKITCPEKHLKDMTDILIKYKNLFNDETRVTNVYEHTLNVNETLPYNVKTYPIPYIFRNKVADEIKKMLTQGIIEKSQTNYVNPVVIVKKKDNSIRICLDARKINQITSPLFEKPVNIETIIGRLKANYIYSKMDLKNSFWLIPLNINSRKYTGFSIEGNIYQFCVVPFGLQSSSAALIRALQVILNKYDHFCIHYIDDILIYSENEQKHYEHLEIILKTLNDSGLKLNLDKCEFFSNQIQYLGYVINDKGITINNNRLEQIKNYPRPKNLRTLRGYLGMLNYYKRFISNLSEKQKPLIDLLRKGVRWKWTDEREKAFNDLKNSFYKNLLLYNPDYNEKFIVRTDASDFAIAGELVQIQNGVEVPICFISRILKSYETRYSVQEKEMLAICNALTRLKFYLLGNDFIIETDHASLQYLMNNRFKNNRVYCWSLLLQEYNFTIRHIPGKQNITADSLSRMNEGETIKPNTFIIAMNQFLHLEGIYSENIIKESQGKLENIWEKLNENIKFRGFEIKEGFIIKNFDDQELYVIDEILTEKIIKDLHLKFGHTGVRKTWKIFRENFYCHNDIQIVKKYINNCELCCMGKYKNHMNQNVIESIVVKHPLEIVAIDYISNLIPSRNNCKHIFVMYDIFTKFIKLYPSQKCNTNTTILNINNYYQEIGKPFKILADNATYFSNNRFQSFCTENNINLIFTSIRHPNANPVERYNQEIIKILRLYTHQRHSAWVNHLDQVEFYMNHVPNTITNISPILTMKNQLPERPWKINDNINIVKIHKEVQERISKTATKFKQKANSKIKKRTIFKLGDLVIIRSLRAPNAKRLLCSKLQLPYEGPYKIVKILGENTYELLDENTKIIRGKFHINLLYPYKIK